MNYYGTVLPATGYTVYPCCPGEPWQLVGRGRGWRGSRGQALLDWPARSILYVMLDVDFPSGCGGGGRVGGEWS